jgi:hypothetical protein
LLACSTYIFCYCYFQILLNLFWHTDKNSFFWTEVNFWDLVRNESSSWPCLFHIIRIKGKRSELFIVKNPMYTFFTIKSSLRLPLILIIWNRHGHECLRIGKLSAYFTFIQCINAKVILNLEPSLVRPIPLKPGICV